MYPFTPNLQPDQCLLEPLLKNSNCVLTFTSRSGGFDIDPETGNELPSVAAPITLNATVKYISQPMKTEEQFFPGQEQRIRWLDGHIVNPTTIPATVTHLSAGRAVIDGIEGDVILYNPRTNALVGDTLGTKIYLVFIADQS